MYIIELQFSHFRLFQASNFIHIYRKGKNIGLIFSHIDLMYM